MIRSIFCRRTSRSHLPMRLQQNATVAAESVSSVVSRWREACILHAQLIGTILVCASSYASEIRST